MVVTELGVFTVERGKGMTLTEIAPGTSVDEVKAKTGCAFEIAKELKTMAV
jgi:3-oxoacid CoA-transferase